MHLWQLRLFISTSSSSLGLYSYESRLYSPDPEAYEHRFPLNADVPKVVGNRFSMEDLHRAMFMGYALYRRRCTKADAMQERGPSKQAYEWKGYADPDY